MKTVCWIALILVIIGALNWGMVGFFNIDVISNIFARVPAVARLFLHSLAWLEFGHSPFSVMSDAAIRNTIRNNKKASGFSPGALKGVR